MAHPRAQQARELWRHAEPVHAVTYFSAEPLSALRSAGYKGFWMGYFAGRAQCGAVSYTHLTLPTICSV